MDFKEVDAKFVQENLGKIRIVDVRPPFMYKESRIPGAISIPLMDAKEADGDTGEIFCKWFADNGFTPEDEFIVYCYDGGLALEACTLLAEKGYTKQLCYTTSWIDWISDPSRPIEE